MSTTNEPQNQDAERKGKEDLQRPKDDNNNSQSDGYKSEQRDDSFIAKNASDPKKGDKSKEQDQSSGPKN